MRKERVRIGWAEADITPKGKVDLYGQYYQRVSEGIHSRLGLTVLALESESGDQAVMVSLGTACVPEVLVKTVREKLAECVPGMEEQEIRFGGCCPGIRSHGPLPQGSVRRRCCRNVRRHLEG